MHGSRIPIWFFIGILLLIYGVMILGAGIVEWSTGNYPAGVQLNEAHAPIWWGGVLAVLGLFYTVKFRPAKSGK
ncbi:MAG TPA: hypothetical protein VHD85_08115 [Terracidiphilus sp.]|jgi:hypothetical protein|nr:hypothetical protein [Terracidiphilus sp.]